MYLDAAIDEKEGAVMKLRITIPTISKHSGVYSSVHIIVLLCLTRGAYLVGNFNV
jgi:hypothetical protein